MNPLLLLILSFFVLIALRVNIGFSLIVSSVFVMYIEDLPLTSVVNQMYSGIDSFTLLAVPFFMLLGRILNAGSITERLLKVADATVGHVRGGLGHVNVFVSMIFASLSGSAAADTASVGSILIPAMKKAGYDPAFAVALTAASSTLGVIIPPSIILIVYGAFGNVSIGALFLGGVVPGLLIGLFMMLYTYVLAIRHGYPANPFPGVRVVSKVLVRGIAPLLIPVLVLGGIVGGYFTPTEGSIVAVGWALFLSLVVYRDIPLKAMPKLLTDAVIDFAVPLFTVAGAGIFGWLIAYLGAAEIVVDFITGLTSNRYGIMLLLIGFLLLIGTVLNPISATLIFLPIIQALGNQAGFDPVHLGVLSTIVLSVGLITPPYGICLLIASQIGEVRLGRAMLAVLPICGLTVLVACLSLWFPSIVLGLPKWLAPQFF
ncbi:TRAP dicarboxylate transporter subunit DctM [Nitratireductor indicus C115]|uniref:TRAP transporter large permease protein n=1 Tax=Nitratireductor indicus C115 TaxID=1231190 RepID=K2PI07_9HYPH|nr:TRAP transporter large permease [Nitratireductor indicus]EKF40782.1 TRAP dicarboxylate transporter subunit DctM [Nitratireductor indicus C115]SFQ75501.1 TRAP transporter, DctM subunit [Nitratireductor indicus]